MSRKRQSFNSSLSDRDDETSRSSSSPYRYRNRSPIRSLVLSQSNALYRETNSSRLRQEIKGMKLSGVVGSRSKSNPMKHIMKSATPSLSRTSSASSPSGKIHLKESPRSRSSSSKPPLSGNTSRRDTPSISRHVSSNASRCHSPPDALSRTSSSSRWSSGNKEIQERMKLAHEKTTEALQRCRDSQGSKDSGRDKDLRDTSSCSGYGKPLVTPVTMNLAKRDKPFGIDAKQRSKPHLAFGSRAPVKSELKIDVKGISLPGSPTGTKSPSQWRKLPAKGTGFADKLRANGLNARENTKMVMNTSYTPKPTKNFDSINNKSPKRSNKPLDHRIATKNFDSVNSKCPRSYNKPLDNRVVTKNFDSVNNKSPKSYNKPLENRLDHDQRPTRERSKSDITRNIQHEIINIKDTYKESDEKIDKNKTMKPCSSRGKKYVHMILKPTRDTLPLRRSPSSTTVQIGKPFKPQLEDIESSYLILNKKNTNDVKPQENATITMKPPTFNEDHRKQQLKSVKEKFQSRAFRENARYEKIEGLNWISWK